jgi:hypothetical protein
MLIMNYKLVITLLVFSFISTAIWLELSASNNSENTSAHEINELKAELKALKVTLSNTIKEDHAVQQQLISKQQQIVDQQLSRQPTLSETELIGAVLTEEEIAQQETIAMEEEKLEIEAKVNYLQTEHLKEDVDEQWGPETERSLADNFVEKSPEDSILLETGCRSTFCRITIANNENADFNPHEIVGNIFSNAERFYRSTVDSSGTKITELYVSRNGHALPVNDHEDFMEN